MVAAFDESTARRLFAAVLKTLDEIANSRLIEAEQIDEEDVSVNNITINCGSSPEAVVYLGLAANLILAYLDGLSSLSKAPKEPAASSSACRKLSGEAFDVAKLLSDHLSLLFKLGTKEATNTEHAIISVCERWWHGNFDGRDELAVSLFPLLLYKSLGESPEENDIKRLCSMRHALDPLNFDDPRIASVGTCLLRAAVSPLFLQTVEGRKFVQHLFAVAVGTDFAKEMHQAVLAKLIDIDDDDDELTSAAYASIYYETWKSDDSFADDDKDDSTLRPIEEPILDLVKHGIYSVHLGKKVRAILDKFVANNKNPEVQKLLLNITSSLTPVSRANLQASTALGDVFLIHDPTEESQGGSAASIEDRPDQEIGDERLLTGSFGKVRVRRLGKSLANSKAGAGNRANTSELSRSQEKRQRIDQRRSISKRRRSLQGTDSLGMCNTAQSENGNNTQTTRAGVSRVARPRDQAARHNARMTQSLSLAFPSKQVASTWIENQRNVVRKTITRDADDLQKFLLASSRGNITRAGQAISTLLDMKENAQMKDLVRRKFAQDGDDTDRIIVDGLRDIVSHVTQGRGSRNTVDETLVKDIARGSLFSLVKNGVKGRENKVRLRIGLSRRQMQSAKSSISSALEGKNFSALIRALRSDASSVYARRSVFLHGQRDKFTRFDSNQPGKVEVMNPSTNELESVDRRIWNDTNVKVQLDNYLQSEEYAQFQRDHPGLTVSLSTFRKLKADVLSSFVGDPKPYSCVDVIVSSLIHTMRAIFELLLWNKVVRSQLKDFDVPYGLDFEEVYHLFRKASFDLLIEAMSCLKQPQPDLCATDSATCPTMVPFKCTLGTNLRYEDFMKRNGDGFVKAKRLVGTPCPCCGIDKKMGPFLNKLSSLSDEVGPVAVSVWEDERRAGNQKQRELVTKSESLKDLVQRFRTDFEVGRKHYGRYKWANMMQKIDEEELAPHEMLCLTDFSAQLRLKAILTLNCSVDNHAVCCNFVFLYNRRLVTIEYKDGTTEDIFVYDVDVHHGYCSTIERGKKNDHVMHNALLDHLMKLYRSRQTTQHVTKLIAWTDGAGTQYKCRQNFVNVATFSERHPGMTFEHNIHQPGQGKSICDGAGRIPALTCKELEKNGVRSKDAEGVFTNCHANIEFDKEETKWHKYEKDKDPRLKAKGVWGFDRRTNWYVTEDKKEYERLEKEYPGRIILVDRSFVLDTHKSQPLKGSDFIFHVASQPSADQNQSHPRNHELDVGHKVCRCRKCKDSDPAVRDTCPYRPWRMPRTLNLEIDTLSPDDGRGWVGDSIVHAKSATFDTPGELQCGKITDYTLQQKKWMFQVKLHSGDTIYLQYREVIEAKKFHDSMSPLSRRDAEEFSKERVAHQVGGQLLYGSVDSCLQSGNDGGWTWNVSFDNNEMTTLNYQDIWKGRDFFRKIQKLTRPQANKFMGQNVALNNADGVQHGRVVSAHSRSSDWWWAVTIAGQDVPVSIRYRELWNGIQLYKSTSNN